MLRMYIESQVTVRDLASRILLALRTLEKSRTINSVVIGRNGPIQRMAQRDDGYAYVADNFSIPARARFERIRSAATRIYAFCDESTALNNESLYLHRRASVEAMDLCDHIFATSKYHADLLTRKHPPIAEKVTPFGLPRIDLMKRKYRHVYDRQTNEIKNKHGDYILIASNGVRGSYSRLDSIFEKNIKRGELDRNQIEEIKGFYENLNSAAKQFDEAAIELAARHPDTTFIYRGKPSSQYDLTNGAATPRNFLIDSTLSVHPWIIGAKTIIHQNCTTGIEAHAAGTRGIDFLPPTLEFISKAPHAVSEKASDVDELSALIGGGTTDASPVRREAKDVDYFFGQADTYASDGIAEHIARDYGEANVSRGKNGTPDGGGSNASGFWTSAVVRYFTDRRSYSGRGGDIRFEDVKFFMDKINDVTKVGEGGRPVRVKWHSREIFELVRDAAP